MNTKNSKTKISMVAILLAAAFISGCHDEPSVSEKVEGMLVSVTWNKPVVTIDGIDQSNLYQDFTITFTKTNYSTSGGSPLWPTSGTWKFTDETAKAIRLDENKEVQINEITETNLELAIQNDNTTFKSGRINSVKGINKFRLIKK
jgi:PBP1b-binding outer membrane lipoprotein LpoB